MSNYVKSTDFAAKDALLTGNPSKIVKGTEINAEFAAVQVADATSIKGGGSSVDNAIARFDGTGGYLLQTSGAAIDDSGNLTANGAALTVALPVSSGGTGVATLTGVIKGNGVGAMTAAVAGTDYLAPAAIGVTVQAYDVDTAKLDVVQSFTTSQRGTQTTDNDLSFDLNATNNFKATPTGGGTLTFTNIASASGQSGHIVVVNGSNYAIAAAATTKVGSSLLTTISATGTYLLAYYCDGTNVYVTGSGALE